MRPSKRNSCVRPIDKPVTSAVVCLICVLLASCGGGRQASVVNGLPPPSASLSFFRNAYCYCGGFLGPYQYQGTKHFERFDPQSEHGFWSGGFINAHGYSYDVLAPLKSADTTIGLNLYKDAIFVADQQGGTGADRAVPTGVSFVEAFSNHREWFLTTDGAPLANDESNAIRSTSYLTYMLMDFGNPAYQEQFARNVIAQAQRDGWDGIFLDDVFVSDAAADGCGSDSSIPCTEFHGLYSGKYPTRLAWRNAMTSFLQNVAGRIRAVTASSGKHLLVFANVHNRLNYADWLSLVDGVMEEAWIRSSPGVDERILTESEWQSKLTQAQTAENLGKYYLAMIATDCDRNDDHVVDADFQAILYGLASALLITQGHTSLGISGGPSNGNQKYYEAIWWSTFDAARALGKPAATYEQLGAFLFQRKFENGTVVVNAGLTPQTITVNGSPQILGSASGQIVLSH